MTIKAVEPSRIHEILLVLKKDGPLSSSEIRDYIAEAEDRSRKRTRNADYGCYPSAALSYSLGSIISRLRSEGYLDRDPNTRFYSLSRLGEARVNELMTLYLDLAGMSPILEGQNEES